VPADKTIAQVLENGVAVPLSCEMGICGACLTPVIDGVVDHRDSVQSEAEKGADGPAGGAVLFAESFRESW
jgi:vanillate O-demethylase ferredoxin subunit